MYISVAEEVINKICFNMNVWAIKEPEVRCDEHPQRDYL